MPRQHEGRHTAALARCQNLADLSKAAAPTTIGPW